jgi:tetratricopeptide (TPR) repeat protein
MVQDRIYGLTRTPDGTIQYSTSMLDANRAVQFREGVRLGRALPINVDRLCHFAKKDMSHGRLEEAQGFYAQAKDMDPTDGRPYLGLSRIAQRRGDLERARGLLREGIARSTGGYVVVRGPGKVAVVEGGGGGRGGGKKKRRNKRDRGNGSEENANIVDGDRSDVGFEEEEGSVIGTIPDLGPNPFLLQALGSLEQELGNLSAAEELYLQALRSRPSHAAAWVALAQLRTRELRRGSAAGRLCYRSAERELTRIGARPNAYVYTAWASMEYKKGDRREDDAACASRARELYRKALVADPRCSAAYLQLGVMESECGNYDEAESCFEEVLKFDQRNSRVLQAYAIMESRRAPKEDVDSRRVLDLFERALKADPRDAGVYQAYALYVAELGDVDSARDLLRKGTEVNKRHAPVWQAWGVLETRYDSAKAARDVFQQGIWSCAQPGGGQSGGRRCARLWQAWGVLESKEGDHAAARRCFSRALDADKRNVAAVTAWTLMEAELGNFADARSIFERALKLFRSPSVDKTAIWRAYEVMEERAGHTREAQLVFQRSMRESMSSSAVEEEDIISGVSPGGAAKASDSIDAEARSKSSKRGKGVEVSRWDAGGNELDSEVWMNNGSIEVRLCQRICSSHWVFSD